MDIRTDQAMPATEKLYYQDNHLYRFQAQVLSCEALTEKESKNRGGARFRIALDQTAFFPIGGGQDGDVGTLTAAQSAENSDPAASVRVIDTREKDGVIWHFTDGALPVGSAADGQVDELIRFTRMQQHSAEHIVTGLIHTIFGYDNVGFHLGEVDTTLDFNGLLTPEDLDMIEYKANQAVFQNIPFIISYPTKEEAAAIEYRSKIEIEDQLRLVTIPGIDICACCAPHVTTSGEIGMIRIIDAQHYKGGMRLALVSGYRALADSLAKEKAAKEVSRLLSVPVSGIAGAAEKLKEEIAAQKEKLISWQDRYLAYQKPDAPCPLLICVEPDMDRNQARRFVDDMINENVGICAFFIGTDETGYNYIIGSRSTDTRETAKQLNSHFTGKGGGRPDMVQGSLTGSEAELRSFLAGLYKGQQN